MVDAFAELEAQYCPPLDSALLSAIVSDYNLSDQNDLESAKLTLDSLKESAQLEEQAGFDASGTGGFDENVLEEERAESCPETSTSLSRETDITSTSSQFGRLNIDEEAASPRSTVVGREDLEKLDHDTKIQLLQDLFGEQQSRYSIEHTLKKCDGNWNRAMEELLNHVYFGEADGSQQDAAVSAKSIDAFSEETAVRRGRKGKSKNKRFNHVLERRSSSVPVPSEESPAPSTNKWKSAADDVEFIASRIRIPSATVSSVYYEKGASISKTIAALLKASMEESKLIVSDDAIMVSQINELGQDFPSIALDYLGALVRLTYPSTTAAHELAKALTTKPKDPNSGGITIVPQLAPPDDITTDSSWSTVSKKPVSYPSSRSPSLDPALAGDRQSDYALAKAAAFSKARAAHRKAKSDRLMGGAAAYYGQVGRDYAALSASASARAADQLTSSQSTPTQLDLHGVDVANAVRIAQEKVEEWWDRLGESRVNGRIGLEDRQMGYTIIVGSGRHSEGGRGKLGPAVTKMLRQEGWRIEPAGASIVVKGPAKT